MINKLFIGLSLITTVSIVFFYARSKNKIIEYKDEFIESVKDFELLLDYKNGYLNNYKLQAWKKKNKELYEYLKETDFAISFYEEDFKNKLEKFKTYFELSEEERKEHNTEFIKSEKKLYSNLFKNIENRSLDQNQRKAVISDEDNNLVIAGAGSGKTTTIVGKVSYIVDKYKVSSDEILLISFTRKASQEMKDRINKNLGVDIDVLTFHKLGLDILTKVNGTKPNIFQGNLKKIVTDFFDAKIVDKNYLKKLINFFAFYLKPYKGLDEFDSYDDFVEYIKSYNYLSLKGETLRSCEEVEIANFLYLNNVDYKYKDSSKFKKASKEFGEYKQDFYLPDYNLYIEHFALTDDKNNVPKWFKSSDNMSPKEVYNNAIIWKRRIRKSENIAMIETYSYEKTNNVLLSNLEKNLKSNKVKLVKKSLINQWQEIKIISKKEIKCIINTIETFLIQLKSNGQGVDEIINILDKRIEENKNLNENLRNREFLDVIRPMYDGYVDIMEDDKSIDFSDMINNATKAVKDGKFKNKYKYIIIDEYQDISTSRYNLIKALKSNNPSCKLFCVGDDWQSIYKFAGSNINLFTEFEKYFGVTEISHITKTYRFSDELIKLTSKFILKNPNQVKKKLTGSKGQYDEPVEIIHSPQCIDDAIDKILNYENNREKTREFKILVLARYNFSLESLDKNGGYQIIRNINSSKLVSKKHPTLDMEIMTVHKSKGLEAEYVILIDCITGIYGFPSEISEDPIMDLLLEKEESFLNAEERRVFYVALTRCKEKVFILSEKVKKSKFVEELEPNVLFN